MGGSASKTEINSLSSQISNIASSVSQSCEVTSNQDQNLTVKNSGFSFWTNYNATQQSDISSKCFSDTTKQTDLQNQIISAIAQTTTASGVSLLSAFGASSSEALAKLSTIIRNNITMSNIQTSYNSIKQQQNVTFENSGVVLFQSGELLQGSKLFAAATLSLMDKSGVFNTIQNSIDQQSTATTSGPLDFLSSIFGSVAMGVMAVILLFVFIIIIIIVIARGGGKKEGAFDYSKLSM